VPFFPFAVTFHGGSELSNLFAGLKMTFVLRSRPNIHPGHDIKLPIRRFLDYLNPVAARSSHKDGSLQIYRLYEDAATKVVSCMRTHTRCDIGPSLQPGLLYTHPDLTIITTTNDASLSGEWYWYETADGNSKWALWLHRLFTLLGAVNTHGGGTPCSGRPKDAFDYKYKGG
jgi:hypothetical protein